jgi:hypothetical protein
MPRKVFVSGEILTASAVNTNLMDQSVMVFDDATARTTALPSPTEGMVTYLKDSDGLFSWSGSAWVPAATTASLAAGTILQVVSATDATARTTTSASYVDASISVTITPIRATSTLIVGWSGTAHSGQGSAGNDVYVQIANSSDVGLSGAEEVRYSVVASGETNVQIRSGFDILAFVAATDTAARTYKGRWRRAQGTARLDNDVRTGRMFVMEVAG